MKLYNLVFSPTGGTKKVADRLSDVLEGDITTVDLTDSKQNFNDVSLTKEDVAVIAVPSYGGRVPVVAAERLGVVNGNGARAILVCVYGNRAYEGTLVELDDVAKQAGFQVIAAVAAVAEHSIVRRFAAGRPSAQDTERLSGFAKQIQQKLFTEDTSEPTIPGNRPYKKAGKVSMTPKPTKECTNCGICAEKCPVQAIDRDNSKKLDNKVCISCMRCIAVCPQSARKVNPVMLSSASIMLKRACSDQKEYELYL